MTGLRRIIVSLACLAVVAVPAAANATVVPITDCFQSISRGQVGVLMNDLDCHDPSARTAPVTLHGARLELRGHSIVGEMDAVVQCLPTPGARGCSVHGPGSISIGDTGVEGYGTDVRVARVTLSSLTTGIATDRRAVVQNVTADHVDNGVVAILGRVSAHRLVVTGCNSVGVHAHAVRLVDSSITGCVEFGVLLPGAGRLIGSTLSGSGADIAASEAPSLLHTTCDHSRQLATQEPLGICSQDP